MLVLLSSSVSVCIQGLIDTAVLPPVAPPGRTDTASKYSRLLEDADVETGPRSPSRSPLSDHGGKSDLSSSTVKRRLAESTPTSVPHAPGSRFRV